MDKTEYDILLSSSESYTTITFQTEYAKEIALTELPTDSYYLIEDKVQVVERSYNMKYINGWINSHKFTILNLN